MRSRLFRNPKSRLNFPSDEGVSSIICSCDDPLDALSVNLHNGTSEIVLFDDRSGPF